MSAKHTPGPWTAEKGGRGAWIKGVSGEWAALACGDTDESADANARLIAAAPELLNVARRLAALESDDGGRSFPTKKDITAARAAIARATGEQG